MKKPDATRWQNSLRPWWGSLLAGVLVLAGGLGYRLAAAAIDAELSEAVALDPSLSTLPLVLGPWNGEDVELLEGIQRVTRNDDYVNRRYRDTQTGDTVILYIGYTARPRTMLGHRPTVCYPSTGWSHLATRQLDLMDPPRHIPALVHSFLKPGMNEMRTVVLNYYVLNGQVTIDEDSFWGIGWRDPNLRRDATRYVAQVQVSALASFDLDSAERIVKRFATDSAHTILALLPETGAATIAGSASP